MKKPELPTKTKRIRKEVIVLGKSLTSINELVALDRAKSGVLILEEPAFKLELYQGGGTIVILEWVLGVENENYEQEMEVYKVSLESYRKYLRKIAKEKSDELNKINKELIDLD